MAMNLYGPAALCRMDDDLIDVIRSEEGIGTLAWSAGVSALLGSACYGLVFGIWRSPLQAMYSAVKMPILIFSVIVVSILVNTMLAQVAGARLSFLQTGVCILVSMAIASILLCVLSPVLLFFQAQCPRGNGPGGMAGYRTLLVLNTAAVGLCGIVGNVKLFSLLDRLTGSSATAGRVLTTWIFVTGLVGCELSWVVSPFLARPDVAVPFLNPNAFTSNFFEYLWMVVCGGLS
jgi:hypothetical protein